MDEPNGPSAGEMTHDLLQGGEILLGIDDFSLSKPESQPAPEPPPPPAPASATRKITPRTLLLIVMSAVAFVTLSGGACLYAQQLLRGGVVPDGADQPAKSGSPAGSPSQSAGSGAHDENAAGHVDQSWTPTYVKVGTWEIALARQQVVTEDYTPAAGNAPEGKTFAMVALYVVNKGPSGVTLTAECFSAKGSGGVYPLRGFEGQVARPGNPVAFEGAFEVPRGTQGLAVAFTPPDGGGTATLPLPEIAY